MTFQSPFDPDGVELPIAGKTSLGMSCECDCHRISNTFHCVPCCNQNFKFIREETTVTRDPVTDIVEIKGPELNAIMSGAFHDMLISHPAVIAAYKKSKQ